MAAQDKTPPATPSAGGDTPKPAKPPAKAPSRARKRPQSKPPGKPAGTRKAAPRGQSGAAPSVSVKMVWAAIGAEVQGGWSHQGVYFRFPQLDKTLNELGASDKNALVAPVPKELVTAIRDTGVRQCAEVTGKRAPALKLCDTTTAVGLVEYRQMVGENNDLWAAYLAAHPPKPFQVPPGGWDLSLQF